MVIGSSSHGTLLAAAPEAAASVPRLDAIVAHAVNEGASDIHMSVGLPPNVRVAGDLAPMRDEPVLTTEDLRLFAEHLAGERWVTFDGDLDCRASIAGSLLRVNIFGELRGLGIVLRTINGAPPSLEELFLPPAVTSLADLRFGLVLVCGVTGSGKSTTLAGMVDRINHTKPVHIITIEDPIEYIHQSDVAVIHQREVNHEGFGHTTGFSRALRSALREDPDVILVGEMRDAETIESALIAAETGHLVLATLHAGSADQAPERIIDALPSDKQNQARAQLAAMLQGVIVQSLVPAASGRRRVCISEVMLANTAVRAMIREGKTHQLRSVIQSGGSEGMVSYDASLAKAVVDRRIRQEDAITWARDENELRDWVTRFRRG